MAKHKWHNEIVAWANGADIEYALTGIFRWHETSNPHWDDLRLSFRIKPPVKDSEYLYVYISPTTGNLAFSLEKSEQISYGENMQNMGDVNKFEIFDYYGKTKMEIEE